MATCCKSNSTFLIFAVLVKFFTFISINIPVAINHYSFCLKALDDWQTKNKSVGCITHLRRLMHKLLKLYDEIWLTTKLRIRKWTFKNYLMRNLWKSYKKLSTLCKLGPWSKIWPCHSHWWSLFPVTGEQLVCRKTCAMFWRFFCAHAHKQR